MKKINSLTKIIIGASATCMFAFAAIAFVLVPKAKAATYPDILVGHDLSVGSTGQDVTVLQGLMSEMGYLKIPQGVPFGYYGPLTENAVSNYQSSHNISPSAGYFGPITKTEMADSFAQHGWLSLLGW